MSCVVAIVYRCGENGYSLACIDIRGAYIALNENTIPAKVYENDPLKICKTWSVLRMGVLSEKEADPLRTSVSLAAFHVPLY